MESVTAVRRSAAESTGDSMSVLLEAQRVETERRERPLKDARAELERARAADERVTERELLTACARAVEHACRSLSLDEREDMAAKLAETVARKAGGDTGALDWRPPRRLCSGGYLRKRAAYLWARERERLIAGRADALPSVLDESRQTGALNLAEDGTLQTAEDAPERYGTRSILAAAADLAGHPAPAPEHVDAAAVCAALGVTATAADAVRAAMSGWGSALDLARALNVSHAVARKRLQRGRDALRAAYPDPAALLAALGDALADAPDPERMAERVRLTAAERAAEDAVTAVKRSPALSTRLSAPGVTLRATRRNWRGYLRPSLSAARVTTYSGRKLKLPAAPSDARAPRCAVPALYALAAERARTEDGRRERAAFLRAVGRAY